MILRRCILILLFGLLSVVSVKATHNRAGEITYVRIAPFSQVVGGQTIPVFHYSITVIVYTDHGQTVADRCADTVYFGDGLRGIAYRINGNTTTLNCGCNSIPCGELIIDEAGYRVKKNIYTITHYYPGAGTFTIQMYDPNRNAGVYNIPNSDQQPFYLESVLIITNASGANSSPRFDCDPIYRACLKRCFYHNPCAYDADHDSLSYELTTSRGWGGATVPGYTYPEPAGPNGYFGINAINGTVTWCYPMVNAEFNIAFIVKEWRKNSSGTYVMIGYVLRDMQVVVKSCLNDPPLITIPQDTCVEAGTLISKKILVTDNPNQIVTLTGNSGAFESVSPKAFLSPTISVVDYTSYFTWQTTCDHISNQPYQTVFRAVDNYSTPLAYYATYSIKVVPPAVKNVTAVPLGSSIKVSWSLSNCTSNINPLKSYKVYRRESCDLISFTPCQTGVPPNSGFVLLSTGTPTTSQYIDDNGGNGLVVGRSYSYLVVAVYMDGTETFASASVCAKLKRDIPVITKVDIRSTSTTTGVIDVAWEKPVVSANNLDTTDFPGPYQFVVKYRPGASGTFSTIHTYSNNFFLALNTSFTHSNVNTVSTAANYIIEFKSGTVTVGNSQVAASVFLNARPADRRIQLSWTAATPWLNYKYQVWKKAPTSNSFVLLDTTSLPQYLDTNKVVNKYTYCYKIISEGAYSDPGILKPLFNTSQEVCATAVDSTAPCTPTLTIEADCPTGFVKISWNNVNNLPCGDDVDSCFLYFKKTIEDPYELIYSGRAHSYTYDGLEFISGCYSILSKDTTGNYSALSPDFCLENCPLFELPNVVTPNNDNANDFYKAVKVRQIKEIDIKIYDRWGTMVYASKDPYFKWNVISIDSSQPISEGTLFYTCDVFEIRLKGTVKRTLKGWIQVVR